MSPFVGRLGRRARVDLEHQTRRVLEDLEEFPHRRKLAAYLRDAATQLDDESGRRVFEAFAALATSVEEMVMADLSDARDRPVKRPRGPL